MGHVRITPSEVPGPFDLTWWQWQGGHTRTHLEHGS